MGFDAKESVHELRRSLSESISYGPVFAFGAVSNSTTAAASYIAQQLPANLRLQTWTTAYAETHGGRHLIRIAHVFAPGESTKWSVPVTIDLCKTFPGLVAVEQTILTGTLSHPSQPDSACIVTLAPMETKTFLATFSPKAVFV